MRVEEKTKRRQRHTKHVRSKMRFTVLRISDLEVKSLEEYEAIVRGQ
jgi:large subunit ribosomal protein L21